MAAHSPNLKNTDKEYQTVLTRSVPGVKLKIVDVRRLPGMDRPVSAGPSDARRWPQGDSLLVLNARVANVPEIEAVNACTATMPPRLRSVWLADWPH